MLSVCSYIIVAYLAIQKYLYESDSMCKLDEYNLTFVWCKTEGS